MTTHALSELILMRHGETDWNRASLVQGQEDQSRLTSEGRAHVVNVAQTLRHEGFTKIIASDLHRAQETATIVARALALPVETSDLLRERNFGVLEGGPRAALVAEVTGVDDGVVIDATRAPAGGETLNDVAARAKEFFTLVANTWSSERLLVVTHGGTIRVFLSVANGHPLEGAVWGDVDNASLWRVHVALTPPQPHAH